jgi:multidrug efflux system outer membrane protein
MNEEISMRRCAWLCLPLVVLFWGCAVGPDYVRPALELPPAHDNGSAAQFAPFTAEGWWQLFEDQTLDRIEQEALRHNRDLKLALARVEEARALARIAFADRLPALGAGGGAARGRLPKVESIDGGSRIYDLFEAFGFASFELDLWGKYRRLDEAARAELLTTKSARDAVRLWLTADVAQLYFNLRTLEAQTRIAREQLASYDRTLELYRKRHAAGYTQELDLRRIEADRLATEALVYQRENALSQAGTALALLLGRSPRDLVLGFTETGKSLNELDVPVRLPDNMPSDLLGRRPDIRQQEGMLMAANARIGAARAAFFPSISLTGRNGFISSDFQDLFTDGSNAWNIAGNLSQPIFEGGRLFALEKAERARRDQMLALYEQAVQNAFRETRDALVAGEKTAKALGSSLQRALAMRRSLELSRKQHARGYISIIDVLDIQRQSLRAELELTAARQSRLDSIVALCRAMGGGWQGGPDETRLY